MSAPKRNSETTAIASAIEKRLRTKTIGHPLHVYEQVTSTNSILKEFAEQDMAEGCTVIALSQTAGRGRHGREWESPPGEGLYMSVLLRPSGPANMIAWLPLLGGMAVLSALKESGITNLALKWPNDVLVSGKKIAGVLAEPRVGGGRIDFAVLGIGVNIRQTADSWSNALKERATSCHIEGSSASYEEVTTAVLAHLEHWYYRLRDESEQRLMQWWVEHGGRPGL